MSARACPWWLGYLLASPLRRWLEDPVAGLQPYVRAGMTVLEPGPGMGFFTVELARLVGPEGRVVAVDFQEAMLAGLRRRAARAGVAGRIETRRCAADDLGVGDLAGRVDLAVVLHMLHEVPDQARFLAAVAAALRPGGALLVVEPRGHVSAAQFAASLACAVAAGLVVAEPPAGRALRALLRKPEAAP